MRKSRGQAAHAPSARRAAGPTVPLYRRVAGTLRRDILGGAPPAGERLPAECELCRRFGVSRHTIRQALRQLRDEGLIVSRQGAGTIVQRPAGKPAYVQTFASIEELIPYAAENRYDVEASVLLRCDAPLARKLGCARGEQWLRITGCRYAAGESAPICWTEVYIRPQFRGVTRRLARHKGAIYAWIEEMYGQRFAEVRQTLRVCAVPKALAAVLGVEPAAAVVEVCRVYRLTNGTVAEVAFNLHPAERFSYSMTLHHKADS
jgi:DNA-binding GntR family transcriptional regulator